VTGRSLHDALLRVLTSADLRRGLGAADGDPVADIGAAEITVLRAADRERLGRLARFFGRHFYRERIVRLFAASRVLARARGQDPLLVLETPSFAALLDEAELGSAGTADVVAGLVEAHLDAALGGLPYGRDLVRYEGALFRSEAGPRGWREGDGPRGDRPVRSGHARVVTLGWDVTGLASAVRRGVEPLPDPPATPTRLLLALSPESRVTVARCPDAMARLLDALDGVRSVADVARAVGVADAEASRALDQLTEVGAVAWTTSPRPSSRSSGSAR
jgi:hypothetical protein